ncbi:MAG: 30S ribosomal protein S16 [Dehalococcoidia bacterium]|jgi:small subunit ribosomal protein S16|nr:30S ribosomal protein S16 [Dehalococcoidia bacterium]
MIRIRLKRIGKKRHPFYRLVVADKPGRRDGRFIETLGSYDPHANPPMVKVDGDKAKEWIGKGAQPSEAAEKILVRAGVIEKKVVRVTAVAPAAKAAAPAAKAEAKPAKAEAAVPVAEAEAPAAAEEAAPVAEAPAAAEEAAPVAETATEE